MRRFNPAVLLLTAAAAAPRLYAADTPRPRGVGPEFAKFYQSSAETFTCISNPAVKIPLSHLNDDYCDCPDGSDEPGTAACAHLSPLSPGTPSNIAHPDSNTTLALPGYYCKNKGHNPTYIPFTYINDGICDYELCCDGSDEWEGVGGVKCDDRCNQIGKEWKKQNEQRQKSLTGAMRRRKELVADAGKRRQEIKDNILNLETQIQASEVKVAQLEREKEEIERREQSRIVKGGGAGGKAGVLAGLAKTRITELKEAVKDLQAQRNVYKDRAVLLEEILATFKEEYNPNFNDEGVKRAVRSWDDYAATDKPEESDPSAMRSYEEIVEGDDPIDWEEFEREEPTSDVDVLYRFEAYLPVSILTWVDTKLRDLRTVLQQNGILAVPPDGPAVDNKATQGAVDRLKSAERDLENQRKQKKEHEDDLSGDYGRDDVFRPLKDKCISLDSGEYTYELCWMKKVTQKSKKGHSQNGMGNFARFDTITVDEDVQADGKGLGSGERVVMKFDNGAHCWNGPSRSTSVIMACAENEEVWKVVEEEKCVYRMEVGTPAVCETLGTAVEAAKGKDEL